MFKENFHDSIELLHVLIDKNNLLNSILFIIHNLKKKQTALPEILASDLRDQSVYESTPVSFEIIAQGIPKLDAQWTLNDKPLKPDDHYSIIEDGQKLKYKLSIADVKLTDAGTFKVKVSNKLGELSKQCTLSVMRKSKLNVLSNQY